MSDRIDNPRDGWKEIAEEKEAEIQHLRAALERIRKITKESREAKYHVDNYLLIEMVAEQALSTTTEPCVCESIKCECGYHEPNGVERVRYAYTCPNCENLIEPEDASKAGMRCPTCRVKEIVPLTIVINAAKGDGNA